MSLDTGTDNAPVLNPSLCFLSSTSGFNLLLFSLWLTIDASQAIDVEGAYLNTILFSRHYEKKLWEEYVTVLDCDMFISTVIL